MPFRKEVYWLLMKFNIQNVCISYTPTRKRDKRKEFIKFDPSELTALVSKKKINKIYFEI